MTKQSQYHVDFLHVAREPLSQLYRGAHSSSRLLAP
ncbi:hypothetical protein A2U01_0110193, partial [Trifolium medium]|nr:hypothetical protein [Trifolium medium]